ncbi:MAG TPA: glycoside hydrolase family 127 protein, partial [Verrucomicrobiota bacterium]|nr:glycoside hydrolase family 127 protein [Verrucomicrobiota bacterium]
MIPGMWRLMSGTNYTHFLRNFEIAAGLAEGRSRGASFNDGDFYKWLEAACAMLIQTNDAVLRAHVDRAVEVIARAQRADGYLHTPVLIRNRYGDTNAVPFQDRNNFEMYNMGHLMTAACMHRLATGRDDLMAVATKAADFLEATFRDAGPEAARSSVCPSHYMGLVDLYRATGETRYLNLARRLFDLRSQIKDGGDDNQDRIPFIQQTNAMGHAVRANYLYAGAADLFMETGDPNLWKPLEPIWTDVVRRKMHITGGCGALYDGASPDGSKEQRSITRVHQAYGRNYQLPNTTAHNETCANIGNVLWNWR